MSENLQLKPGHLWLELPVLFHRVTTTGQSSAPTILYMYCTGGTEMLRSYVYPTATPGCHSSVAEHKLHACSSRRLPAFPLFSTPHLLILAVDDGDLGV